MGRFFTVNRVGHGLPKILAGGAAVQLSPSIIVSAYLITVSLNVGSDVVECVTSFFGPPKDFGMVPLWYRIINLMSEIVLYLIVLIGVAAQTAERHQLGPVGKTYFVNAGVEWRSDALPAPCRRR